MVKNEVCDFFKNSCTRINENWQNMKFDIFLKIHLPGLQKMAKIEVCDFFENSCTRVYKNGQKMKFDIFFKLVYPGSMKIS